MITVLFVFLPVNCVHYRNMVWWDLSILVWNNLLRSVVSMCVVRERAKEMKECIIHVERREKMKSSGDWWKEIKVCAYAYLSSFEHMSTLQRHAWKIFS